MAGLLLADKGLVLAMSESAYNTDAIAAAIAAQGALTYLAVHDDMEAVLEVVNYVPPQLQAAAGGNPHQVFVNSSKLSGSLPMRAGVGTAFTPNYGAFLKQGGWKETVGAISTTYSLDTAQQDSMTFWQLVRDVETNDYMLMPVTGLRGNTPFAWELEKEPIMSINSIGASAEDFSPYRTYFGATDKPVLYYDGTPTGYTGTVARDTAGKLGCKAMTLTVGGTNYPAMSVSFDPAWTPTPISTLQASPTVSKIVNTRNNTTRSNGQIVLMDGAAALTDAKAKWASGAEAALIVSCDNGTESMRFEAENIQLGYYSKQAQGGVRGIGIPYFVVQPDASTDIFGEGWATLTYAAAA